MQNTLRQGFNFKDNLVKSFPGYNSAADKTSLAKGFLIRGSKNVYKKNSGTIASRPGLRRRGAADSTDAGVKASWEWETSFGLTRPLRVANGKLQVESDILTAGTFVWYDLVQTSTLGQLAGTLTRFVFDSWWDATEKKDRVLFVRGDDNIFHWSGGIAKVFTATASTITKTGTDSWATVGFASNTSAEKKIVISGVEYTYTGGETTTILTGVTPDPSGIATDSIAVQAVIVSADKPADGFEADIIKVIDNQAYVASYSSRLVYISLNTSFTNYSVPSVRTPGSQELLTLDGAITAIAARQGRPWISAGTSDWYEIKFENTTIYHTTNGAAQTVQVTKVEKRPSVNLAAALGHEFVDVFGDDIVYLAQDKQLRTIGNFVNESVTRFPSLSLAVESELKEEDFSGGHLRVSGDTIYITAPNNTRDWMYQIRQVVNRQGEIVAERLWHPPQIRGISRFAVIDGVIYGHSNVNPQIYQVWDTNQWFDDNPSDEPIPYNCTARFAYQGGETEKVTFDKIWVEGYMPNGVELLGNAYIEYQGNDSLLSFVVNDSSKPAKFWLGNPYPSLGDFSLGDNPLGDGILPEGGEQETIPKFRKIVDINPDNHFESSIEFYTLGADSRWEILQWGTNMRLATEKPAYLRA